ncbi:GNAT family N-acetyltransferase [Colwellia sp. RE-S-Sl-9]
MFEINKATKQDKKDIKRFYKDNNYSASFMGYDHTYIIKMDNVIIGSVILSYITNSSQYGLLHALLITPLYREKGYAKLLIETLQWEHNHIICFADKKLYRLYKDIGFKESESLEIPSHFIDRYNCYLKKNNDLKVFLKINYSLTKITN